MTENVVWEATPKQAEFLACPDYEVLFGGAVGGGKSDSLLIDGWCLQHGGPANPNHRAVVFRRSFPELKDLIDRARDLFPKFIPGIKYDANEHRFTSPAGAKFEFGYLSNDNDRFKYRGRAWNWIGFDELTLWPTPVCYLYLQTRNRSTDTSLPRLIRATTNPDGPGQKWVMERWGIEEDGAATRIKVVLPFEEPDGQGGFKEVEREIARSFIPSKLADNPHLRGTGYRETLLNMPPEERDALLYGKWTGNRVEGAYYFRELQRMRTEGRVGRIPHESGVPCNTFWDLGWNDYNSIWVHQSAAFQNRFIHAYQNCGEALAHYVHYLQQLASERSITWDTHYLPHDAGNSSLQTGKTAKQMLEELWPGQRFRVVPRVPRIIDGIQATRAAMSSCFIDDTPEGCADGIAALAAYRKRYNNALGDFTDEPVHDSNSNYADAFRQFAQGYDKAQVHIKAAEPEWKKKLRAMSAGGKRNPMTA